MLQQVHEFIKKLKERLKKEWCLQSWSKEVRFGAPRCSQEEIESGQKRIAWFVTENYKYC